MQIEQLPLAPLPEVESSSTEASPLTAPKGRQALSRSPLVFLGLAFGLALAMWAMDFQPVSSDTTKLTVAYEKNISDDELLNPKSPVWDANRKNSISRELDANGESTGKISTTIVPMSAQYIAPQQGGSILQVQARAAFNDKTMAVQLQWKDSSKSVLNNVSRNQYSDSAALEFPLVLVPGHQPFRCMGQSDAQVNIWQWKAERDPAAAGDGRIYSTGGGKAAKSYLGPGLGYLKDTAAVADPDSVSSYDEATQTWTVIFRRPLAVADANSATQFKGGQATLVAFALWDGGAGERLSKKAVSTWVDFIFQPSEGQTSTQSLVNVLAIGFVGVLLLVAVAVAWRVLPGNPRKTRE